MGRFDRKEAWPAVRNALLIVAAIHILILLRNFDFKSFSLKALWTREHGQLLNWLAWSLVAPVIAILARFVAVRRPRWFRALGILWLGGAVCLPLLYLLEEFLKMLFLGVPFFESSAETVKNLLWSWDLPIFGLILSISLAWEYDRNRRQKEVRASRLEKELAVATLSTLKAQIQPHFLFNTLHVISSLVKDDPEAAEKMISRLSDLLRASTKGADAPETALTDELDMLMNYVEIVQVRFRDRLRFELNVHPETAEARIPGFFLQPLVENAVRHGIARKIEGGTIRVDAHRSRKMLVVRVADTGPGFSGEREDLLRRGTGLANLQRRLELLYPGEFRLDFLRGENGGALVVVEIPFRTEPRAPGDGGAR